MEAKDLEHVLAVHDPEHACNQGSLIALSNVELLPGYNQERSSALCRTVARLLARSHAE